MPPTARSVRTDWHGDVVTVLAYVSHGRWVADCSRPDCTGAELAIPGEAFRCHNCQQIDTVEWPDDPNPDDIMKVLSLRPVPSTRNWFPNGHPRADAYHVPTGESLADLVDENAAHGIGERGEHIPTPPRKPPFDPFEGQR